MILVFFFVCVCLQEQIAAASRRYAPRRAPESQEKKTVSLDYIEKLSKPRTLDRPPVEKSTSQILLKHLLDTPGPSAYDLPGAFDPSIMVKKKGTDCPWSRGWKKPEPPSKSEDEAQYMKKLSMYKHLQEGVRHLNRMFGDP